MEDFRVKMKDNHHSCCSLWCTLCSVGPDVSVQILFKCLGSVRFSKEALNWLNVTAKTCYKRFIFQWNAVWTVWTFYLLKRYQGFHKHMKQHNCFSALIIIRNVSWAANLHIRMISEGSCDTEDWSNDAENTALITEINLILQYIHTENSYLKL